MEIPGLHVGAHTKLVFCAHVGCTCSRGVRRAITSTAVSPRYCKSTYTCVVYAVVITPPSIFSLSRYEIQFNYLVICLVLIPSPLVLIRLFRIFRPGIILGRGNRVGPNHSGESLFHKVIHACNSDLQEYMILHNIGVTADLYGDDQDRRY